MLSSHLRLGLPKGIFPVGLPVKKILKAFPPSSILATSPAHLNLNSNNNNNNNNNPLALWLIKGKGLQMDFWPYFHLLADVKHHQSF